MNHVLASDIVNRLSRDFDFKQAGSQRIEGLCPACGKKSAYAYAESPWTIQCNRLNNCGYQEHVRELFPELFESWSDRFVCTQQNPHAAADAYLSMQRGFDLSLLKKCYTQETFVKGKDSTATVRFTIAEGVFWERLIDKPQRFGSQKANFRGSYKGLWWQPPSFNEKPNAVWVVSGIFDALALAHHGINAVATLGDANYPDISLKAFAKACQAAEQPLPKLVWALDGDKSGKAFSLKHARRAETEGWPVAAAMIPQTSKKRDWNDCHQLGLLDEKHIGEYRYHGDLLLAKSVNEKACLMYMRQRYSGFVVEFNNRTYWASLKESDYKEEKKELYQSETFRDLTDDDLEKLDWQAIVNAMKCKKIASCTVRGLYFMHDETVDESWYYCQIGLPGGYEIKKAFSPAEIGTPSSFKNRLLRAAPGASFTGSAEQLDKLIEHTEGMKTVESIDYIGYTLEHRCYVFNDFAVKDGQLLSLNSEDYFQFGKLAIKSRSKAVRLEVDIKGEHFDNSWVNDLYTAYGLKGLAALAWWIGSLFAEQIREKNRSYPFIEIVGDPGTGKSTLLEFLWKLVGRDHEGSDPNKDSAAARNRQLVQVANLPTVMIEADREGESNKNKQFDWDETKTLYNGRGIRARGVKNFGNETYSPPFRGALVLSQNAEVAASDAVLQRIVHLHFRLVEQNERTKAAANRLINRDIESLSYFLVKTICSEKKVLETFFKRVEVYELQIMQRPDVHIPRLALNHAQMMALADAMSMLLPIDLQVIEQLKNFFAEMAAERQQALNKDHPIVQQFWDIYDFLENDYDEPFLNHSADNNLIAINLNHFFQVAIAQKQPVPDMADLKRFLRTSRTRRFVEANKAVSSTVSKSQFGAKKTMRCWVFKRENSKE